MYKFIIFVISMIFLLGSFYSMKDLISWYNTLFGIIGFIGSTVSIKTYLRDNKLNVNNLNIFNTVALKQDFFTNRINEIKMILELLNNNNKVISVYGNKGVGKSEFLKIITDYINNNIKSNKLNDTFIKNDIKRDKYHILKNYKAIYFDLSDKMGMKEIITEIFSKIFPNIKINKNISYHYFLNELEKVYNKQNIIFIFDNFNNGALKSELIKIFQEHQIQRCKDLFIIGSINEFISYSESILYIEITSIQDKKVIKEFAAKKGIDLTDESLNKLYSMSYGLPIYLNIILNNEFTQINNRLLLLNINEYIIDLVSKLDEETMRILKYCAFISALNTTLKLDIFIELGFNSSSKIHFEKLIKNSLLIDLGNNTFKMHDIITDFIIEKHIVSSQDISVSLINYYKQRHQNKEVVIYSLLTNDFSNKELIIKVLKEEIDNDNLPYLFTLGELIRKYQYIKSLYSIDSEIYNYLIYSYLYMKMGMGDYIGAEELVNNLLAGQIKLVHISDISSDIEFEFNYLVADLLHLQNKYTKAINDFRMLLNIANMNKNFNHKIPKCTWAIAHSGRHQAENLNMVLNDYNECYLVSEKFNDIKYLCRAINGKLCINLAFDNLDYNYLNKIDKVYEYADKYDSLNKIVLSTMKYHAILLRKEKNFDVSKKYLDKAYTEHKKSWPKIGR